MTCVETTELGARGAIAICQRDGACPGDRLATQEFVPQRRRRTAGRHPSVPPPSDTARPPLRSSRPRRCFRARRPSATSGSRLDPRNPSRSSALSPPENPVAGSRSRRHENRPGRVAQLSWEQSRRAGSSLLRPARSANAGRLIRAGCACSRLELSWLGAAGHPAGLHKQCRPEACRGIRQGAYASGPTLVDKPLTGDVRLVTARSRIGNASARVESSPR